jgi:hypothetical protein
MYDAPQAPKSRSPLTPRIVAGGQELPQSPRNDAGDARGISEDFGSTQRCVYTVAESLRGDKNLLKVPATMRGMRGGSPRNKQC